MLALHWTLPYTTIRRACRDGALTKCVGAAKTTRLLKDERLRTSAMEPPTTLTLTHAEEELLREALRIERLYFETLARAADGNPVEFHNYRARVEVINELLARLELNSAFEPTVARSSDAGIRYADGSPR
jgi:hypothetical protein